MNFFNEIQLFMVSNSADIDQWNSNKALVKERHGIEAVITYIDAALLIRWAKFKSLGQDSAKLRHRELVSTIAASLLRQYGNARKVQAVIQAQSKPESKDWTGPYSRQFTDDLLKVLNS